VVGKKESGRVREGRERKDRTEREEREKRERNEGGGKGRVCVHAVLVRK